MKCTFHSLLLCFSIFCSGSVFAVSSFCNDGPIGSEPWTIYHEVTLDFNDWEYGWLHIYTNSSGTLPGFADEIGGIYGSPGGHHAIIDPIVGVYQIYGLAEIGIWISGGEGGGGGFEAVGPWDECNASAVFPSPTVNIYSNDGYLDPDDGVVLEGQQVTLGYDTSPFYGANCIYLGNPAPTSYELTFTANSSHSDTYTVQCFNHFGQAQATKELTVLECSPPPASVTEFTYQQSSISPGSDFGRFTYSNTQKDYEAYCDGTTWKVKWTLATVPTGIGVDMHNVSELTDSIINSTTVCQNLDNMIGSLDYYSDAQTTLPGNVTPETAWYVEAAFLAHEELHFEKFRNSLDADFANLKFGIESVSIPIDDASSVSEAHSIITGLSLFEDRELDVFDAAADAFDEADHPPWSPFNAVQHSVSDPWVAKVQTRKAALSCP